MNKNMKKTTALLLILMLCVSILAGCGGGLSGKYVLVEMSDEDGSMIKIADYIQEQKDFYEEMEWDDFDESYYGGYIEFLSGGKCNLVMYGDETDGLFKVEGKNVIISNPEDVSEKVEGTINGNRITLEAGGGKLIFEKK